jgi:hypothetical protein
VFRDVWLESEKIYEGGRSTFLCMAKTGKLFLSPHQDNAL